MASLLKNIAEPYNKDKVYNTKDMALYNNLLYLCIYNNVSGEFNSSKWIEVQLTDLVQGKLRGIEDYSGKVIDASYVEQDDDYTYFGVPQKAFVDDETSFRTLNSSLSNKLGSNGTLAKGSDLNDIITNSIYVCPYEDEPYINIPVDNFKYFILITFSPINNVALQIASTGSSSYVRKLWYGTWGNWNIL